MATDLLEGIGKSQPRDLLAGMRSPNKKELLNLSGIGRDTYKDVSRITGTLQRGYQAWRDIPQGTFDFLELLKNNPGIAAKSLAAHVGQAGQSLYEAPAKASRYLAKRGVLPNDMALQYDVNPGRNQHMDYRKFYGLPEQQIPGEGAISNIAQLPFQIPAFMYGGPAGISALNAAQAMGNNEGPLLPALLGYAGAKVPQFLGNHRAPTTAKKIANKTTKLREGFNKDYESIFGNKKVAQNLEPKLDPKALAVLEEHSPSYFEGVSDFINSGKPIDLNYSISDLKALKRSFEGRKSLKAGERKIRKAVAELLPEMEKTLTAALEEAGPGLGKKLKQTNTRYRKDMVPLTPAVRKGVKEFKEGAIEPLDLIKLANNKYTRTRYGKEIPGIKRVKGESMVSNILKNPYVSIPSGILGLSGVAGTAYHNLFKD